MSQQLSNYVIETSHKIGRGSSGVVYLGHHKKTKDKVAVKKVYIGNETPDDLLTSGKKDSQMQKLWNEIRIMKSLKHPNVVALHSVQIDLDNGFLYLIMEYCDGNDLSMYIKEFVLDLDEVHHYMTQIKNGLQYLRSKGIVHRDLKPHNILIHNNQAKIADFGLSIISDNETNLMKTVCGSPLWMSPEIIEHQRYTAKSDLWSIGIIIYQLIYRKHPFIDSDSSSFQDLRSNMRQHEVIYPEQPPIDSLTQDLLNGLLSKDCHRRMTWEEFFNHPWFKHPPNKSTTLSLDMSHSPREDSPMFSLSLDGHKPSPLRQSTVMQYNESSNDGSEYHSSGGGGSDTSEDEKEIPPATESIAISPPNIKSIDLSQYLIPDYQKNQKNFQRPPQYSSSAPESTPPMDYSASRLGFNSMGSSLWKYVGQSYKWFKGSMEY